MSETNQRTSAPSDDYELAHHLYRPIVFERPQHVVDPPSWVEHIPFAFWLVDVLRPEIFVELGTQAGTSYSAFAQAIQLLRLPTAAYAIDTWTGDAQAGYYGEDVFATWADYHERHFSSFSRLIRSTFRDALSHFSDGGVDLLHIDGYHTYESVRDDFELWRHKLSGRAVVLIHDINVRDRDFGAWRFWEELKTSVPTFEFLHGHGLGVAGIGHERPEPLQWLFSRATACPSHVGAIRQFFATIGSGISAGARTSNAERELRTEREDKVRQLAEAVERLRAATEQEEAQRNRLGRQVVTATADAVDARRRNTDLERELTQAKEAHRLLGLEVARGTADLRDATRRNSELEGALATARRLAGELLERTRALSDRLAAVDLRESAAGQATAASASRGVRTGLRRIARSVRGIVRTPSALGLWTTIRLLGEPATLRDACLVVSSGLFDAPYYRSCYPDVASGRVRPLAHFIRVGALEGRNPHPLFDTRFYLRGNPDVAAAGNPLVHYLRKGAVEKRSPHPLFDVSFYLAANPDVERARVEPLHHFLVTGASEGRDPSPFFNCRYYLEQYPDVARSQANPLRHFVLDGWRERRRPSPAFDTAYYLDNNADVTRDGVNPLSHYVEYGRLEGRRAVEPPHENASVASADDVVSAWEPVKLRARSLEHRPQEQPAVLCLSHVVPFPPRAGNEYRIYRMLRWLKDQGYRIIPVIAPLPGEAVGPDAVRTLADHFSNAVICDRDGRLDYVLRDVPDVLGSLRGELSRPIAALLDDEPSDPHERQVLQVDRTFCHDAVTTAVLRLDQVLGRYVLLAEYIWMSRLFPLLSRDAVKVIDTHDVFSLKQEKVGRFGIDTLHLQPHDEARRLARADLVLAIQDEEREVLQSLVPETRVLTVGVDFHAVGDMGTPSGKRILCVGSDNSINQKGLRDFIRFAWPRVRQEVPDAELLLAGRLGESLDDLPGVCRLGPVEDLRPLYAQARLVINPAIAGTGLKIKTIEALCHFRPIVTWPNGTDGLPKELAALCTTARDWYGFARHVVGHLRNEESSMFSHTDRELIARFTAPATVYAPLTRVLADLLQQRAKPSRDEQSAPVGVRTSR